jgi:ribulose 1,5-bisphosphate carboxylase large subunit-like protein
MRQAIDATLSGISLPEAAQKYDELGRMVAMLDPDILKNFDLMN